jgi:signal transduction histidine kinase
MTATLSHEIRNALGSIKGYAQWVDERVEATDPKKKGLAAVLQGTMRIESLVNDLLLFSREETYSVHRWMSTLVHESMAGEATVKEEVEPIREERLCWRTPRSFAGSLQIGS